MRSLFLSLLAVGLPVLGFAQSTQTFTITAYYSPLPGQERYITGSFASEVFLNGEGHHAADGTAVGPGLVAAPKGMPFGTVLNVPGYGLGEVHDWGEAIVEGDGHNYSNHPRLDLWMGYGDPGLAKALAWGIQTLPVKVYEKGTHQGLDFPNIPPPGPTFPRELEHGMRGEDVRKVQRTLATQGFFTGPQSGYFGDETEQSLMTYQLYNRLISTPQTDGAGRLGPRTQLYMSAEITEMKWLAARAQNPPQVRFERFLTVGDKGEDVQKLQAILSAKGYLDAQPTGYFGPKTRAAVTTWQRSVGLISSGQTGGHIGPGSRAVLNADLGTGGPAEPATVVHNEPTVDLSGRSLIKGAEGARVLQLQHILAHKGYLNATPNGFFGEGTHAALVSFQLDTGLILYEGAHGTGVFGPGTQAALAK